MLIHGLAGVILDLRNSFVQDLEHAS
jgi:hypothetical protein